MMKAVLQKSSRLPCRPSWFLVEVQEETTAELYSIHLADILGESIDAYASRKVRFTLEKSERTGIIRFASDDPKNIEDERSRLLFEKANQASIQEPLKVDLWCLVRQTTDESKVRLITVSSKRLTSVESTDSRRKHFQMQNNQARIPVILLHIIDSEQHLFSEMSFLNDMFLQNYLNEEKDQQVELWGLEKAFFLVQYFEDQSNLIYTIVRYRDTIWKDQNKYPNVVAYITDGSTVSQSVILRKSYEVEELKDILAQIRKSCDNMNYPLLLSKLKESASSSGGNQEAVSGS